MDNQIYSISNSDQKLKSCQYGSETTHLTERVGVKYAL